MYYCEHCHNGSKFYRAYERTVKAIVFDWGTQTLNEKGEITFDSIEERDTSEESTVSETYPNGIICSICIQPVNDITSEYYEALVNRYGDSLAHERVIRNPRRPVINPSPPRLDEERLKIMNRIKEEIISGGNENGI